MKIHEYQAKELLRAAGVPVPRGYPAFTVREAQEAAQKLGGSVWVVKAQIHAGGRGKGGGVKLARSMAEVETLSTQILGMQLKTHQTGPEGQKVRRLYIEEGADIDKEYYVSLVTDRATQKVAFIASSEGGMDIEEVAHSTPEKIVTEFIDPLTGLGDAQAKKIADAIGLPENSTAQAVEIFQKLYACYMATDASLVEINPLNRDSKGQLIALDAKFNFDATSTKKIRPRWKPASSTSATSAWTATSVAWSTAPVWPWPPWTPSSSSVASRRTSSTSAAAPPPRR
jgi:succinyl-CoA synthetase beta subunit